MWVAVVVALIASLPGIGGLIYSWRKHREIRMATATEFGTKIAKTAFEAMEVQVKTLTLDQKAWSTDRESWYRDRAQLLDRVVEQTAQLRITNHYLSLVLAALQQAGIPAPAAPSGFDPYAPPVPGPPPAPPPVM